MLEFNDHYYSDVISRFVRTDEWERQKIVALRRARKEQSRYLSSLTDWIIRHLRKRIFTSGANPLPQTHA